MMYFRDVILQSQHPEAILSTTLSEKVIDTGIHYHPSLKQTERWVQIHMWKNVIIIVMVAKQFGLFTKH
jgi:hypothetical protein